MEGTKMTKEINEPKTNESSIEKEEIKKIVAKSIKEPTHLYFSSPCFLSEIEDNEDISNL